MLKVWPFSPGDIEEPRLVIEPEEVRDVPLGHVAVDQQDLTVALACQAEREVDAGEGLAFAGHGARHHDEVGEARCVAAGHGLEQRPLDDPVVLREPALLVLRCERAVRAQDREIDAQHRLRSARHRLDRVDGMRLLACFAWATSDCSIGCGADGFDSGSGSTVGACLLSCSYSSLDEAHG